MLIAKTKMNQRKKYEEIKDMTKAQLKEKYLEWNREITKKRLRQDEIFKELQRMNKRYGSGTAYCSIADLSLIHI